MYLECECMYVCISVLNMYICICMECVCVSVWSVLCRFTFMRVEARVNSGIISEDTAYLIFF